MSLVNAVLNLVLDRYVEPVNVVVIRCWAWSASLHVDQQDAGRDALGGQADQVAGGVVRGGPLGVRFGGVRTRRRSLAPATARIAATTIAAASS